MKLNFLPETERLIENLISDEFDKTIDDSPLRDQLQSRLTDAYRSKNYRLMALSLEAAGDYFSNREYSVQEAVRLYQDAIFCLSHDESEKQLSGLVANLDYDRKGFESNGSGYIAPDLFLPGQLNAEQNSENTDFAVRLLFKAGTSMLMQSQKTRADDFFLKALQVDGIRPCLNQSFRPCILANRALICRYNDFPEQAAQ